MTILMQPESNNFCSRGEKESYSISRFIQLCIKLGIAPEN